MGSKIQGENGYVKTYRSVLRWEWFTDPKTAHLWEYIRTRANYDPEAYRGIQLDRGEFLETIPEMALATGLSVRSVRTALKHLKSTGEIDTEVTHNGTIVKVLNYAVYQDSDVDE